MSTWKDVYVSFPLFESPTVNVVLFAAITIALCSIYSRVVEGKSYGKATIVDIRIYPIKSCRGMSVKHARITARGLVYDRLFMIVDENKKFITQRTSPELALVETSIEGESLTISAPNMPSLSFPLTEPENHGVHKVKVWGDECEAVEVRPDISQWFSKYLRMEGCMLVRMKDGFERETSRKYSHAGQTGFADGFPFLLVSVANLIRLNGMLANPVTMTNFRPNIIVDGTIEHEEDGWKEVIAGGTVLSVVKHCSRCKLPNVLPDVGVMPEDLPVTAALNTYRTGSHLNFSKNLANVTFFGVQLDNHDVAGGFLCVGDSIATR